MTFVFPSVLVSDSPEVPGWWSSPYSEISVSVTRDNLPIKTENILVSSLPRNNYYSPTNLIYYNDPMVYGNSIYSSVSYLDLNGDKELQKKMTRFFYSQLYNEYIPESNSHLLDYVKLNANDVELVKSVKQSKQNSTKKSDFSEKIRYLAENIFTKNDIFNCLASYCNRNNVNWWDLKNVSNDVERLLVRKLETKIKSMLNE